MACGQPRSFETPFLEKPYLQLGNAPGLGNPESLVLLWHVPVLPGDSKAEWKVDVKTSVDGAWRPVDAPQPNRIAIPGNDVHLVFRVRLTGLVPGGSFQ